MRRAEVYRNVVLAGILSETGHGGFEFIYDSGYFKDTSKPGICLSMPKTRQRYHSELLFPFFFNMLSEGTNRLNQAKQLKIDERDFFGLLLATAQYDTIGAITVKKID